MRAFRVIVNGREYEVAIEEVRAGEAMNHPPGPAVTQHAQTPQQGWDPATASNPAKQPRPQDGSVSTIVAQMPGAIVDILVNPGDSVTRGQNLLVLEAMKMANQVVAPQDGKVTEISVKPGDLVNTGDVLIILS